MNELICQAPFLLYSESIKQDSYILGLFAFVVTHTTLFVPDTHYPVVPGQICTINVDMLYRISCSSAAELDTKAKLGLSGDII